MAKRILYGIALVMLVAACGGQQRDNYTNQSSPALQEVARYTVGTSAELRLLSDGNLSQLELYYGGDLQELVGTANTEYVRDDAGHIVIDTLTDTDVVPAYVVRTYDRSSTYGAEVWYVLYPYRRDDPDGPWNIAKVPTDRPSTEDVARYID